MSGVPCTRAPRHTGTELRPRKGAFDPAHQNPPRSGPAFNAGSVGATRSPAWRGGGAHWGPGGQRPSLATPQEPPQPALWPPPVFSWPGQDAVVGVAAGLGKGAVCVPPAGRLGPFPAGVRVAPGELALPQLPGSCRRVAPGDRPLRSVLTVPCLGDAPGHPRSGSAVPTAGALPAGRGPQRGCSPRSQPSSPPAPTRPTAGLLCQPAEN